MEFGMSLVTQYERSRDLTGIADELVKQAELVRDGGFDFVRVAEHHATDDNYLLNETVAPYLARHTGGMSLKMMCLLPYHNPVRIAEFGATMDVLTGGRFGLTVAQGYRPEEFAIFDVADRETAIGRLIEGVEIIKRLWTEDEVDFDGKHFQLDGVSINPKPVQNPRPPITAGASAESSIRRTAHIADGWSCSHVPFDAIADLLDAFRDECETVGEERSLTLSREVYVAETTEQAEEIVREPLMRKYERYVEWGQDEAIPDDQFHSQWEELKEDRFIVGDPDEVITEIQRYRDAFNPDRFKVRTQFKGMALEDVHESQRLLCDEVLPAFE